MDPKILREQLGLAEDASDDDVTAKLAELNERPTEEQVEEQVSEKVDEKLPEAVAAARRREGSRRSLGRRVTLDKAAFEELKASAAKGAEAHDRSSRGQATFIAAAVEKGKFPPSRVEHYTKRYDSDPDGTRAEIDALAEDVVPVTERGIAASSEETPTSPRPAGSPSSRRPRAMALGDNPILAALRARGRHHGRGHGRHHGRQVRQDRRQPRAGRCSTCPPRRRR
jgi:hypothetical protein